MMNELHEQSDKPSRAGELVSRRAPPHSSLCMETDTGSKSENLPYYPSIPFGVNRFLLLGILFIYTTLVSPHFFNWFSWESVFRATEVYAHLCDGTTPNSSPASSTAAEFCFNRKKATDRLFLINQVFMFFFSFISGLLLDVIGPKACCALGNIVLIVGWFVIRISDATQNLYPIGFALLGAGTDACFFGTISSSNVFPENPSLVISILGAARSVGYLLPKTFELLTVGSPQVFTMKTIALIFMFMYVICLCVVLTLVPNEAYVTLSHGKNTESLPDEELSSGVQQQLESVSETTQDGKQSAVAARFKFVLTEAMFPIKQLSSPVYLPIVMYCIANILRNGYYTVSAKDRLGPAVSVLEVMVILSFLPGPVCGYLVNRIGPFPVMHGLNFCIGMVFVMVSLAGVISNAPVSNILCYISTVFALPFMGFILSQVYCYIAIVFKPKDLGKLVGFASLIAGFCGLLTEVLTSIARHAGFVYIDLFIVLISVGCVFLLIYASREVEKLKSENANPALNFLDS